MCVCQGEVKSAPPVCSAEGERAACSLQPGRSAWVCHQAPCPPSSCSMFTWNLSRNQTCSVTCLAPSRPPSHSVEQQQLTNQLTVQALCYPETYCIIWNLKKRFFLLPWLWGGLCVWRALGLCKHSCGRALCGQVYGYPPSYPRRTVGANPRRIRL